MRFSLNSSAKGLMIVALGLVISCCHRKPPKAPESSDDAKKVFINLKALSEPSFFELFSEVEILPLETNSFSVIKNVSKILLFDNKYYILDSDQGMVFIFNSDGSYADRISRKGSGPGEYSLLYDFQINKENDNIELLDARGKIVVLSPELEYLYTVSLPIRAVNYFTRLNCDTLVLYTSSEEQQVSFFSLSQNKIFAKTFEAPPITEIMPRSNRSPIVKVHERILLFTSFSNVVYDITDGALLKHLEWDFGRFNFSLDDLDPDLTEFQIVGHLLKLKDKAWSIYYYYENEWTVFTRFALNRSWIHLMYDKDTEKYLVFEKFKEGVLPPIISILNSYSVISHCEQDQLYKYLNESILNIEQQELVRLTKPEDNPLLLIYKLNRKSRSE